MADTSTVQSNSTSVQSSASAAPAASSASSSSSNYSKGALLKKVLAQQSFGLLCMRLVLGSTMIAYGVPKFLGGAAYLTQVGSAVHFLGINFGYQFFGMAAALVEVVGGIMIMIGAYYRVSCFGLAFVMIMATLFKKAGLPANYTSADFVMNCLHPLSMAGIFASALFLGPGRLSVQKD